MLEHSALFRPTRLAVAASAVLPLFLFAPLAPAQSADAGAVLRGDAGWPRWQGRLSLSSNLSDPLTGNAARDSLSLLGDYYFVQQGLAPRSRYAGGFRATGGLFIGPRASAWSALPASPAELGSGFSAQRRSFSLWGPAGMADDAGSSSVPYVGVGYTGLNALRATGGGWSFSADLGLMALQPRSAVRLGQQSLSDTLRELQLSPLLQLGVSYAF